MLINIDSYLRKDSASASNVYYGYTLNATASDSDFTWYIRRVSSTASGQEVTDWSNDESPQYISTWSDRSASFASPTGSIGLTYSSNSIAGSRYLLSFSWSLLSGVNTYYLTSRDVDNNILQRSGSKFEGPYKSQRTFTELMINRNRCDVCYNSPGTYSVILTAMNNGGSTYSTVTFNLI